MKCSYPMMHLPNMQAICIYITTLTQSTHRKTIHTHDAQTVECISSKTHTSSILSKFHSCSSKHACVCLLTARRSGRRRLRPAARIVGCCQGKATCGKETVRRTLFRYRSACGVRQCVCARVSVSVLYKCALTSTNNNVNRAYTPQRS
jgi:hypothetical protein